MMRCVFFEPKGAHGGEPPRAMRRGGAMGTSRPTATGHGGMRTARDTSVERATGHERGAREGSGRGAGGERARERSARGMRAVVLLLNGDERVQTGADTGHIERFCLGIVGNDGG